MHMLSLKDSGQFLPCTHQDLVVSRFLFSNPAFLPPMRSDCSSSFLQSCQSDSFGCYCQTSSGAIALFLCLGIVVLGAVIALSIWACCRAVARNNQPQVPQLQQQLGAPILPYDRQFLGQFLRRLLLLSRLLELLELLRLLRLLRMLRLLGRRCSGRHSACTDDVACEMKWGGAKTRN